MWLALVCGGGKLVRHLVPFYIRCIEADDVVKRATRWARGAPERRGRLKRRRGLKVRRGDATSRCRRADRMKVARCERLMGAHHHRCLGRSARHMAAAQIVAHATRTLRHRHGVVVNEVDARGRRRLCRHDHAASRCHMTMWWRRCRRRVVVSCRRQRLRARHDACDWRRQRLLLVSANTCRRRRRRGRRAKVLYATARLDRVQSVALGDLTLGHAHQERILSLVDTTSHIVSAHCRWLLVRFGALSGRLRGRRGSGHHRRSRAARTLARSQPHLTVLVVLSNVAVAVVVVAVGVMVMMTVIVVVIGGCASTRFAAMSFVGRGGRGCRRFRQWIQLGQLYGQLTGHLGFVLGTIYVALLPQPFLFPKNRIDKTKGLILSMVIVFSKRNMKQWFRRINSRVDHLTAFI